MQWDVFISHASEDKEAVALPLCKLLKEAGLEVWLDQEDIRLGESIPAKINQGLAELRVGLVIANPRYFEKSWTQEELRTLLELELAGKIERIIPIWHQIDKDQILQRFPSLGHRLGTNTDKGIAQVALEILKAIDPEKYDETHPIFLEQQRKAVCCFLEAIEEEFRYAPIFHPPHKIVLQEQYIPIEVSLERRYRHEVESIRGYLEDEMQLSRAYAMKGFREESKKEKEEKRQVQVPWQKAKQQHKRLMVLADPGMGKTALLKMEVLTTAQQARQLFEDKEKNVDDIILPIFLKLFDLSKKPDTQLVETILQQLQHRYQKTFEPIKALIRRKLEQGTCLLLLDALDETPSEQRLELAEHLNIFARHFPCSIICTSRIVGYGGGFLRDAKEVEIVPFTRKQIEQYIEIWFKNLKLDRMNRIDKIEEDKHNPVHPVHPANILDAKGLIRELRQKPQIHGLAQNPLLLSLLCSLYQEDQLTLPARRVQIYEQAVQYMLDDWRRVSQRRLTQKALTDAAWIEAKLELLEQLAYQFSCEYKEVFSMRELLAKIEACKGDTALKQHDAPDIIKELSQEDGIIQQLDGEGRNARYIFLHRTFQEYLTAAYLKRQPDSIELAKAHFWDFDWHETLILFAGMTDDPTLFLNTLLAERDDIFHTLLLLAGKCLTEYPQIEMPQLIDRLYNVWLLPLYHEFVESAVVAIGLIHQQMLTYLLATLHNPDWEVRKRTKKVLRQIGDTRAVEGLVAAFNNPDRRVREDVAETLGEIGGTRAVEGLLGVLHDPDSRVRSQAVDALGRIGDIRAVKGLLTMLHDPEWGIRERAKEALKQIGDVRAMDGLLSVLHDQDGRVREWVTEVLERIGNTRAVEGLLTTLHDPDANIRCKAAKALGSIGDVRAVEGLLAALHDPDANVRWRAAKALARLGDARAVEPLLETLHDPDKGVRRSAVDALGQLGEARAIEGLVAALHDPDWEVRERAKKVLRQIGSSRAVEGLAVALHDPEEEVRRKAVDALERLRDIRAVEPLLETLHDPDKGVRRSAAGALGQFGDARAVEGLLVALHDPDGQVREYAAQALGMIGDARAVEGLLAALHDPDWRGRWYVARALGMIGDARAVEPLLAALHDLDDGFRGSAAQALGQLGDTRAVEPLLAVLHDPEWWIRMFVVEALGKIGDARAVEGMLSTLHDPVKRVREESAKALGQIGDARAWKGLLVAEYDPQEDWINEEAKEALKAICDVQAVDHLVAALHDPDGWVRWHAAMALEQIGDVRAVKGLLAVLHDLDEDVREEAARALWSIGDVRAVKGLLAALHDPNETVRKYAAQASGQSGTLEVLEKLLQRLDIYIYDKDIFPVLRRLAHTFSGLRPQPACLPVYPQPLFLRLLKEGLWRMRIRWSNLLYELRQVIDVLKRRD